MPAKPTLDPGPTVTEHTVTFRLADPEHALGRGPALPGGPGTGRPAGLHLRRDRLGARARPARGRPDGVPVPGHPADGSTRSVTDPANPRRVPGAFGEKSVLEFPGYQPPAWLARPGPPGRRRDLTIGSRSLARQPAGHALGARRTRRPGARSAAARARRARVRRAGRPHVVPRGAWSRPVSCRRCGPRCSGRATATSGTRRTAPTPGRCAWRPSPGCGPR